MNATATSPEALREATLTKIKDTEYTVSSAVEEVLRAVERHVFVPDVALVDAYANDIVVTKRGADNAELRHPASGRPGRTRSLAHRGHRLGVRR